MLELYDLQSDPYEQHDLSGSRQHADQLSELKTWVVEVATQMVGSEILYYTRLFSCIQRIQIFTIFR